MQPSLVLEKGVRLVTDSREHHFGFPRMVAAPDGSWLLFYRRGTTHAYDDATIAMRRSLDQGATWCDERILWRTDPGCSAHNPVPLVTRSGRVLLWVSRYEYGSNIRHKNWWSQSHDGGQTWAPFRIFDPSDAHNCYYITEAVRVSDGLLAADATFPPSGVGPCHTRIHHSSDDGTTWTVRSLLTSPDENKGNEVALMETVPGTLMCILRDRQRQDTYRLWSRDGGRTWTERESIREMLDCVLQRPFLTRLSETHMLLSGRDFGRKSVVAYVSPDRGQAFGSRLVLDTYQQDGGYTSVMAVSGERCVVVWYSDSHTEALRPDVKVQAATLVG